MVEKELQSSPKHYWDNHSTIAYSYENYPTSRTNRTELPSPKCPSVETHHPALVTTMSHALEIATDEVK